MAHKGGRPGWAIAASFAGQAAIIAVVATGSARSGSPATSAAPAPLPAAPAPPAAAILPPPAVPVPAVPLQPGEIPVTMTVTGQSGGTAQAGGTAQTGDIGFPMPEDPPRFIVKPGGLAVMTVDLTVPAGVKVSGLWLGVAADQWTGTLRVQRRLLSVGQPLRPGHHAYTLQLTTPAGAAPGSGNLLVLDVQHPDGSADEAPIAELVTG